MAAVRSRMGADPFAEHGALMKDLYHEYSRREREDLDGMAAVRALLHEASVTAQSRQQRVQDIIEGLSQGKLSVLACMRCEGPRLFALTSVGFHKQQVPAPCECRHATECGGAGNAQHIP